MIDKKKIRELLEASQDGTITAEQVTAAGLHRSICEKGCCLAETSLLSRGYSIFMLTCFLMSTLLKQMFFQEAKWEILIRFND